MTLPKFKDAFVDEMRERVAAGYRARMESMNALGFPNRHPGFMLNEVALLVDVVDRLAREREGIAESYEAQRKELDRAMRVVTAAKVYMGDLSPMELDDKDGVALCLAVRDYDSGL